MTRRDHMDHAFAAALEQRWSDRVSAGVRTRGTPGLGWQATVGIVVAAVVIAASVAVLTGVGPRVVPTAPAPTIEVSGHALQPIGALSWTDAQWTDGSRSTLIVHASAYPRHASAPTCGAEAARASVSIKQGIASVAVEGYARPLEKNEACAANFIVPLEVRAHVLDEHDSRAAIDPATGRRHQVLDPTIIPVPTALPHEFLSREVDWNEQSGAATRIWATDSKRKGSYLDYAVTYFTRGEAHPDTRRKVVDTIDVHGHPAQVTVGAGPYDWAAYVQWSVGRVTMQLASHGNVRNHRSLTEIEQVARSTPDP